MRETTMGVKIEFDLAGRTYQVESPSINIWNVHIIAGITDSLTMETDLKTGERICVAWGRVGVIRLLSSVDERGFATD
jgi:hypothetical protein